LYKIIKKEELAPQIFLYEVDAPRVAESALPGQFIIARVDEKGERVPLTICDYDAERGTVTIVVQVIGASTSKMAKLNEGDCFENFVGPLGNASEFVYEDIEELKKQRLVFIAGGLGTAPVYPQVKWLAEKGVKVDVIIGAKSKNYVIFEEEIKKLGSDIYVCTDDGSYGFKGLVTDKLKGLIESGINYDAAIAIGPMIMMKFVCLLTKKYNLRTIVSLNSIMVDGTGMCGACRVTVNGETKFTCVEGPEFDGHLVDFEEALRRQTMFKDEEVVKAHKESEKQCNCF
jgi:ferredoxin/flavodoxin---NADP+ reductase